MKPLCALLVCLVTTVAHGSTEHPAGESDLRSALERGKYGEVRRRGLVILDDLRKQGSEETLAAARLRDLLVEALVLDGRGEDPLALQYARRALADKRRLLGASSPECVHTLRLLGSALQSLRRHDEARETFDEALRIAVASHGEDHHVTAKILSYRAGLRLAQGEAEEAFADLTRALRIQEQTLGSDHPEVATTLVLLGTMLRHMRDLEAARDSLQRAVAIRESVLGPNHPRVAHALTTLGNVQRGLGDFASCAASGDRAARILTDASHPAGPRAMAALNTLANCQYQLGLMADAEDSYRQALAIAAEVYGPDHPYRAALLDNFSNHLAFAGAYADALTAKQEALAIRETQETIVPIDIVRSLINISGVLSLMGDDAAAEPLLVRALEILDAEEAAPPDLTANALVNLASVVESQGRPGDALPLLRRAIRDFERLFGADHTETASLRVDLASLLLDLGRPADAQQELDDSLDILMENLDPGHPYVAAAHGVRGRFLLAVGRFQEAQDALAASARAREVLVGWAHPDTAAALHDLALAEWALGDPQAAFDRALQADRALREHFLEVSVNLAEAEALRLGRQRANSLDLSLSLLALEPALRTGRNLRLLCDAQIRSRALVLDEMTLRRKDMNAAADPGTARLREELLRTRRLLAHTILQGSDPEDPQAYARDLQSLRSERDSAERRLAQAMERDLGPDRRAGIEEVLAALPDHASLVGYTRYRRTDSSTTGDGVHYYGAVVLRRGVSPRFVDLGPAAPLDELIGRWAREVAADPRGSRGPDAERDYRAAGRLVRESAWEPLSAALEGSSLVLVVSAGLLHQVNLAALPASDDSYLVEGSVRIHYLSAERDVLRGASSPSGLPARSPRLLAVGGPDFDAKHFPVSAGDRPTGRLRGLGARAASEESCETLRTMVFSTLPGAAAEVEGLEAIWKESGGTTTRLIGEAAREGTLKSLEPGSHDVMHFATHGFSLQGDCGSGAAEEAFDLHLTGLALSGANVGLRNPRRDEDGILTAQEAAMLDLSDVSWAVLSSCNSGTGPVLDGEGVLGMRRAFRIAGAGTLILTLWAVEDDATRDWMIRLYRARLSGDSTADAVRRASVEWIRAARERGTSSHPYFWGGFVASGRWE